MNRSRRNFLKRTGTVSLGAAILPHLLSCSSNNKINIAVVGVGGRGGHNWVSFYGKNKEQRLANGVNIVAFCDVNDASAAQAYAAMPDVPRFKDFRVMLDKMHRDIDLVVVSIPDHNHFAVTMAAMEMGKHVYVEKPLAHNIWQLRTLKKAAKHYGIISQMGNQGHASSSIRDIKEWYGQGFLGEVREVHAWFNGPEFKKTGYFLKPEHYPPVGRNVPNGLDWDTWLGPAKERPYSPFYLPRFWRGWYDFGNAELGDWACHTLDAPFWALELGSPTAVEAIRTNLSESPRNFVSNSSVLRFEFPERNGKAPVSLYWHEGGELPENRPEWMIKEIRGSGMVMTGDKMSVVTGGRPNGARLTMPEPDWKTFKKNGWQKNIPRAIGNNPYQELLAAIRGQGPMPGSNFEYSADLSEMALVGVMAQRFNTRIEFDAKNMRVSNHPELNTYIKEPVREGWSYGENLW